MTPGAPFGEFVKLLPREVEAIYNEARQSMQAAACTGAVLLCRTLLTHVATEQGCKESTFQKQIEYLRDENILGKGSADWVDHIRDMGNLSSHKLKVFERPEAELVLTFTTALLRMVYELPGKLPKKPAADAAAP